MNSIDYLSHYIVASGCNCTFSGNIHFKISCLEKDFNLNAGFIADHESELELALNRFMQVSEAIINPDEDDIDMLFHSNFCGIEE